MMEQIEQETRPSLDYPTLTWNLLSNKDWLRISKPMIHRIGDRETIMLCELVSLDHWHRTSRQDFGGWFAASYRILQYHTAQKEDVQRRSINSLVECGLVSKRLRKGQVPATNEYRIHHEKLLEYLSMGWPDDTKGLVPVKYRNWSPENTGTSPGEMPGLYNKESNKELDKEKYPPITPPQSDPPNGGESPSHRNAPKGSSHPVDDNLVGDRSIRYWPKEFVKDQAFQKAWSEWCEYRQAKKKPVAKLTAAGFTKEVSRILQDIGRTPQQVIGAIENSMARDWQGIYKAAQLQQVHPTSNGNRMLQSRNGRAHSVVPQNGETYDFPEKTTHYDNSNWVPTA